MSILSTPLRVAVAVLGLYVVLAGVALSSNRWDPVWFVHFGDQSATLPYGRAVLGDDIPVPLRDGHDGTSFWLIGRDPLLLHPELVLEYTDRPAYRTQRILYPALAAPFGVFGTRGVPWGLLLVNLASVGAGTYLTAVLARRLGAPAAFGLAFGLAPPVIGAVVLDLADAFALALLVAVLAAVIDQRWRLAAVLAVPAVLARDTNVAAIVAAVLLAPPRPPSFTALVRRALVAAPAVVALGLWLLYSRWRLDFPPSQIQEFVGRPFSGYLDAWRRSWSPRHAWFDAASAIALVPFGIWVVVRWWRSRSVLLAACLPFIALVPFLSIYVAELSPNWSRAVAPVFTLVAVDIGVTRSRAAAT